MSPKNGYSSSGVTPRLAPADDAALRDAIRRGATRRQLLAWCGGLGLGAAAATPLIGSARAAVAETPQRGGKLRVAGATASTTETLDPARGTDSTDYSRHYMFYNGLTTLNEALAPQPTLATSFETNDATTWVVKLRSGVQFHDGSPLTAADVVYSLARHKDPATGSKVRAVAMQMADIKATGKNEVTITLSGPNSDLPVILGVSHFLIIKNGTKDFSTANGTGPFRCKSFEPGIRSIAVRNENYWKPGQPYLDEIEMVGIPDSAARVNAALSGDIQLAAAMPVAAARQLERAPGLKIMETKGGTYTNICMRLDQAPTDNLDLVLACKYLFDREQIRRTIFRNYAVIGNDQPIDPTNRYFAADLPQRPYDPEKAKFHLAKSGFGSSLSVTVSPAAFASEDIAQLWQQSAKAAGLDLTLRRVPADGYWTNQWMKHPVTFAATNARPTADLILSIYFKSDAPWNESGWKSPKFDQLLVAARGEQDHAKRKQMYADMQEMISNEAGVGIPVFRSVLDAHSDKLKGLRPVPLGNLMGYTFPDNVWLTA
ncbi:MAG: ABC transporter substrate-binding protein [Rhodospirillales bacterium]|nr:ABC transporter substrate-binding protein [Rhodospirillales bacterium]